MSGVGVGERIFSAEQINVPGDLPAILKEYTKAVLVANPPDVHQFSAECVSASNHCLRLALSLWLPLLCAPGRRARDVPHRFPHRPRRRWFAKRAAETAARPEQER